VARGVHLIHGTMADQGSPKGPPVDTCPPARDGDDTSGPREKALRHPESAVAARERTIQPRARELDGNDIAERESAVAAREEAVLSREDAARLREEAVRAQEELERAKAERERLMIETREANERLVAATRHAQTLSEEAEKANRLKDEFLATVSHELRTPLNAVLGWVRMLAAGHVKGDRVAHAIGTIERNASALAEMIDDLLDVSRIIAGTLEIAHDPNAKANEVLHDDPRPDREGCTAGRHALFSRTMRSGALVSPRLGEHTREVLGEIGYTDANIDQLLSSGAVLET